MGLKPNGYGSGLCFPDFHGIGKGISEDPLIGRELNRSSELTGSKSRSVPAISTECSLVSTIIGESFGSGTLFKAEPCRHVILIDCRWGDRVGHVQIQATGDLRTGHGNQLRVIPASWTYLKVVRFISKNQTTV